jgi:hypothetical protein
LRSNQTHNCIARVQPIRKTHSLPLGRKGRIQRVDELKKGGLDKGLKAFQDKVRADCPALNICEEIANASKHMRRRTTNPNIKAAAEWHPAIELIGNAKKGDLVMNLYIYNGAEKIDAAKLFIDAMGYWEKFMKDNGLSPPPTFCLRK